MRVTDLMVDDFKKAMEEQIMIDWKRTLIKWLTVLCCLLTMFINIGTALESLKKGHNTFFALECITALIFWEWLKNIGIKIEYKEE